MLSTLILVLVTALVFEYINGFHDTANSIATVVATKVLSPMQAVGLAAVANLIASGRTAQIYSAIESGREAGMQTFDQALAAMARDKLVHLDDARRLARDASNFDRLLRQGAIRSERNPGQ